MFSRAVHNFCTSQKAVSNAHQGVIGGTHRGGKAPSDYLDLCGTNAYQHIFLGRTSIKTLSPT